MTVNLQHFSTIPKQYLNLQSTFMFDGIETSTNLPAEMKSLLKYLIPFLVIVAFYDAASGFDVPFNHFTLVIY